MSPRPLACLPCLLVILMAGCRISDRYVGTHTEVQVTYQAGASTTIYSRQSTTGQYVFDRYEGSTELTIAGASRWGLSERIEGESSQAVAQPLGTQAVQLRSSGAGAELVFDQGEICKLGFVRGSWDDYLAGRKIVLDLDDSAWNTWTLATHDAFVALVESLGRRIRSTISQQTSLSYVEDPDILVHEKPLIQADRGQLMIFFEKLEISNRFVVVEWRREDAWWAWNSRLGPRATRFASEVGTVAVQFAVEFGFALLEAVARGEVRLR